MTYCILGSNSFSGGAFIDYILDTIEDATILAISRSAEYQPSQLSYKNHPKSNQVHFHQLDINKDLETIVESIKHEKPSYIFNFCAQGMVSQSWDNPSQWFETNSLSVVKLIDKIHNFSWIKKFVQISTPEVYGECNNRKEDFCFAPSSPYAASKASADLALHAYFKTHNFPVNFTRAANVYGAYQQLYRIIPKTILSIKKNQKISLHGGGKALRSFIHIKDIAKATLDIAHHAKAGESYHLSNVETIRIYDLVSLICTKMNVNFDDVVRIGEERVSEDSMYQMNTQKFQNEFNYAPQISLDEGLEDVIKWIDENFDTLSSCADYYIHKQ